MRRETALALLRRYTDDFGREFGPELLPDQDIERSLIGLFDRFPADGSTDKAMRWLGFAQGAAYSFGLYPLDELKEHSRMAVLEALDGSIPAAEIQRADAIRYACEQIRALSTVFDPTHEQDAIDMHVAACRLAELVEATRGPR